MVRLLAATLRFAQKISVELEAVNQPQLLILFAERKRRIALALEKHNVSAAGDRFGLRTLLEFLGRHICRDPYLHNGDSRDEWSNDVGCGGACEARAKGATT